VADRKLTGEKTSPKADTLTVLVGVLLVLLAAFAAKRLATTILDKDRDAVASMVEAFRTIRAEALNVKDKQTLSQAAIGAMVKSLDDPFSVFLRPAEHEIAQQAQEGEYGAVGMIVSSKRNKIVVVSSLEGSPAQRAGIKSGDEIVEVNNKPVAGLDLAKIVAEVRGKEGTDVKLAIRRKGQKGIKHFTVRREKYTPPVVASRMIDHIGYLRLSSFPDNLNKKFDKKLDDLVAKNAKGIVLDLRLNPGGGVDQAVAVCDRFLHAGTIMSVRDREGLHLYKEKATDQASDVDLPLAILVDGGTASASEIVAGALQDLGRAKIVGTKTFGKGVVNRVIPLPDGSAIVLAVARYFTPNGRSIHERGITPNVIVPWDHARLGPPDPTADPQLRKALDVLRSRSDN